MTLSRLQPVRGTRDLLPDDCRRHRLVGETARAVAERYGYGEIATPIFEFTEVFMILNWFSLQDRLLKA